MLSRGTPRRLIGRLLLSFALLWSQQAAIAHALSHPLGALRSASDGNAAFKSQLVDRACLDCLAHAQFFSALGALPRVDVPAASAAWRIALPSTPEACIVTECMFQSRAPPPA